MRARTFDARDAFDRLEAWADLDPSFRSFRVSRGVAGFWSVSVWSSRWRRRDRVIHSAKKLSDAVDQAIKASGEWRAAR